MTRYGYSEPLSLSPEPDDPIHRSVVEAQEAFRTTPDWYWEAFGDTDYAVVMHLLAALRRDTLRRLEKLDAALADQPGPDAIAPWRFR